jgi:hypothetical protein
LLTWRERSNVTSKKYRCKKKKVLKILTRASYLLQGTNSMKHPLNYPKAAKARFLLARLQII